MWFSSSQKDRFVLFCLSQFFSLSIRFFSLLYLNILIFISPGLPIRLDFKRVALTTFTKSFIELICSLAFYWPCVYCRVREWSIVAYGLAIRSQAHSNDLLYNRHSVYLCIYMGLLFTNFKLKVRLHCFELFIDTGYEFFSKFI